MKPGIYTDLHTHSTLSDGLFSPDKLIDEAGKAGIRALAITDHNLDCQNYKELAAKHPDMELIRGSELSCLYKLSSGEEKELHVVALDYDPDHTLMKQVFRKNLHDRKPYVDAILEKLRENGIDLGTYEILKSAYPDTHHLGRKQIADTLKKRGYTKTADEGFDIYIGNFGEKRAYVKYPFPYASLEEVTEAIIAAKGIPVLAHLFYYGFSEEENRRLLRHFSKLTTGIGALEVEYGKYTREQRNELKKYASEYGLLESAASDFHGQSETQTLENRFPYEIYEKMKERRKQYYHL
ncbi:MAG: PHP domain-containing protein [Lachnospiraceae bacterium]